MKDDRICEYCTYKNVPTRFSPCLGCPGNMDHLIQERKEKGYESDNERTGETGKGRNP